MIAAHGEESVFDFVLWTALIVVLAVAPFCAGAEENARDRTCFQVAAPYSPELDFGSDSAIVYGCGPDFAERASQWRTKGYNVSMMTGIAWGGYESYYVSGDTFKKAEVQTNKAGRLFMHGNSKTVGYNVPTAAYVDYIKKYIEPAVDAGVQAIYLEEPEYWAETGWSEAFKQEWARFYGEPWQPPDTSADAQYRASRLKYELYFKALREVFVHAKHRASEQGRTIECHVPTHSLINYAQWRIVSPESHLMDLPECDGYIAQVWTGTARTPNKYRGVVRERTFETAYLEYGQMLGMVRPTGRKVWFLADPVEDNPGHSWNDYKRNYECTLIASLMWPEVARYEVMPWPDRIFQGKYPKVDMDTNAGAREGIPPDYATELLTVINALNEMDQQSVTYETGSRNVGVIVSDTLMFQRAAPQSSDPGLGQFYGLALPLVKHGIPVEPVQLENVLQPKCLTPYRVLLLTYEGQKPLKREYHRALAMWVRGGGGLIFVDDGSDPYHHVREWWNDSGRSQATASDDLLTELGVTQETRKRPEAVGQGFVRILEQQPSALTEQADGPEMVIGLLSEMFKALGNELKTQNYFLVRRGPFVVASALEESISQEPVRVRGQLIDLFDASLPVVTERILNPGERTLLYDLEWARAHGLTSKVAAAAARVRREKLQGETFTFVLRGPKATHANVRILLARPPLHVTAGPTAPIDWKWDEASGTLLLSLDNTGEDVAVSVGLGI